MSSFKLKFSSCFNIAPNGRPRVFHGQCFLEDIVDLPTDLNIRDALPRKDKLAGEVMATLTDEPDNFSRLNGGVVIVCSKARIYEQESHIILEGVSIIDGAQTRAAAYDFLTSACGVEGILVHFEILEEESVSEAKRLAVTRNTRRKVTPQATEGHLGGYDELLEKMKPARFWYRQKEDDVPSIALLLKVTAALLGSGAMAYQSTAAINKRFAALKDEPTARRRWIRAAPAAWKLYQHYLTHEAILDELAHAKGGKEKGVSAISRLDDGRKEVAHGLVFPLIYAHSSLLDPATGTVKDLSAQKEKKLIERVCTAYRRSGFDAHAVGRNTELYDFLKETVG